MPVRLPPIDEQRRITVLLGALDDKIDSNRRLVNLLQEAASTLFAARFVHFIEQPTDVETELGRLPADFSVGSLGELGVVRGGGTPRTKEPSYWEPPELPWLTPTDMTALRAPVVYSSARQISEAGLDHSSAKRLPVGTVLYTSRATLGHTAIARAEVTTNQGFITIEPKPPYSSEFVLMTLRARSDAIVAKANGSTFLEVNKTNFKLIPFASPPEEALAEFDQVAGPSFRLIESLDREARRLAQTRDTLLPKLVSGEIRVPDTHDAEEVIGPATEQAVA